MKKREVMAPLKPPPPQEEVVEQEPKDLEDDIFDLPKKNDPVTDVTESVKEVRIQEPSQQTQSRFPSGAPIQNTSAPKPKAKRDYSHLTKAREKSLEARRRKKEQMRERKERTENETRKKERKKESQEARTKERR